MLEQVKLGQRSMRLALAATALGAVLASQTAHAVVVVADFTAAPIVIPFNIDGLYINVVTGVTGTTGAAVPGWDINPYFIGTGVGGSPAFNLFSPSAPGGHVGASGNATPLAIGDVVGGSSAFLSGPIGTGPAAAGVQYFGFRFLNGTGTGATTHYGYAVYDRSLPVAAGSVRLLGYAFESTPLTAITIAPIPEPSSIAMMLAGLAVAGGLARKRAAAKA